MKRTYSKFSIAILVCILISALCSCGLITTDKDRFQVEEIDGDRVLTSIDIEKTGRDIVVPEQVGDDVIQFMHLAELRFSKIDSLDVSNVQGLEEFYFKLFDGSQSKLTSLDFSKNKKLKMVCVSDTQALTEIAFNENCESIGIYNTAVKELDLKALKQLEFFTYFDGPLQELDISNNPNLQELWVDKAGIDDIDVSNNPNLQQLIVTNTNIKAIDVSNNPKLTYIEVSEGTEIIGATDARIEYLPRENSENSADDEVPLEKNRKDILTDGRLKESFVAKFSDLTVAEMTPEELAAYREYATFLVLQAEPEDMNLVIEHLYDPSHKENAYELMITMDDMTKEYCLRSSETVDSRILERCTIMEIALTTRDASKPGEISLKNGRYKYEYERYKGPGSSATYNESHTTLLVYPSSLITASQLGGAKLACLENKCFKYRPLRMDEEFEIKSAGVDVTTKFLRVRVSPAMPGTKAGALIYIVYPTDETEDRLDFYNKVLEYYKMEPIMLEDIYNDPEAVSEKLANLDEKMETDGPYIYNGESYDYLDVLDDAYRMSNY